MKPKDEDLELIKQYETEIIKMLQEYLYDQGHNNKCERVAGYMAGLCTVATAIAIGALGDDDAAEYLSACINRALKGVKHERDNKTKDQS